MATRLQWDPWREFSALERQLGDAFGWLPRRGGSGWGGTGWGPALEAFHSKDDLVVRVDLPGVRPEDVDVHVADDVLVIRGERHFDVEGVEDGSFIRRERTYGAFERQVILPEGTDAAGVRAGFEHGVLEVRVPHPAARQPTRVPVTLGPTTEQALEANAVESPGGEPAA